MRGSATPTSRTAARPRSSTTGSSAASKRADLRAGRELRERAPATTSAASTRRTRSGSDRPPTSPARAIGTHSAPPSLPSPKLKLNAKAGTATLTLRVPGPGVVVLSGPGIKGLRKTAKAAGPLALVVRPTAKTAKKLKRDGKAKVIARIAFTPTGGTPHAVTKTLTLKLR